MKIKLFISICLIGLAITSNAQNNPAVIANKGKRFHSDIEVASPIARNDASDKNTPCTQCKTSLQQSTNKYKDTIIVQICQVWDTINNVWGSLSSQTISTYDENGNLTTKLEQRWKGSTWINWYQDIYTYDSNGNQTSHISQYWDETFLFWRKITNFISTYNSQGIKTNFLRQEWKGNSWVNSYNNTYTYDAEGKTTLQLSQQWKGTTWINSDQFIYTYDTNGNLKVLIFQTYNGTTWINQQQWIHTYDTNGNLTTGLEQRWKNSAWKNYSLTTNTYDATGNQTNYLTQDWDGTTWIYHYQETYTYDTKGNQTSYLYLNWNGTTWTNFYQGTTTYDAKGIETSSIGERWIGTSWRNESKCNLTYTYTSISPNQPMTTYNLQLSPNPISSNQELNIGYNLQENTDATIIIYDLLGRKLLEQNKKLIIGNNQIKIDLKGYENLSVLHFISITTNKETITNKLMIVE